MIRVARAIRTVLTAEAHRNAFSSGKVFSRFSSRTTWNKDWKPGPYPKTEEERLAAAKKYNLIPEDYEPYPEEEGYGDYPNFPIIHNEMKDDFLVYDDPVLKRNYGEPMHPDFDICVEDKVNFDKEFRTPFWKQVLYLFSGVSIYTAIILYDEAHPIDHREIPKQYPHRGEVSYTFEPAE